MSRVKHVYDRTELMHLWAHGHDVDIRTATGNVFTGGDYNDTIYSYGYHFPLAKRFESAVRETLFLVNPDSYSVTTSRHQLDLAGALSGVGDVIHIDRDLWPMLSDKCSGAKIRDHYNKAILAFLFEANRSRYGYVRRDFAVRCIRNCVRDYEILKKRFKFRVRVPLAHFVLPDLEAARAATQEREETRRAKREALHAEQNAARLAELVPLADRIAAWRRGESVDRFGFPSKAMMRVKLGVVETSQGAVVNVADVRFFIEDRLPILRANPGEHFPIMSCGPFRGASWDTVKGLTIGCHVFSPAEVVAMVRAVTA